MVILKRIPRVLSPKLLNTMARAGHGDTIVLADANFPAASVAASCPDGLIRADGIDIPQLLEAMLELLPLDSAAVPCQLMEVSPDHRATLGTPPVWAEFQRICNEAEGREVEMETIERFAFYEEAKKAFAVVATGEEALYGNLIIRKGFLPPEDK